MSDRAEADEPTDQAEDTRRVGFVLAGVQKAGTSTLFALIRAHPQVAEPRAKELHYFSNDKYDWKNPDYREYDKRIRWRDDAVIAGEATPRYLFWRRAMIRMQAYNPDMRIILSFRDPIERAFSHWAMAKDRHETHADFAESVWTGWAVRWPRNPKEAGKGVEGATIVSRGFYGQQLRHALGLFPREQFLLLDYHTVFADLPATLDRIATFIGVDPFPEMPTERRVRAAPERLVADPPTGIHIAALARVYDQDLRSFSKLSGIDVSAWPTSRVMAGTLDPDEFAATLAKKARLVTPDTAPPELSPHSPDQTSA